MSNLDVGINHRWYTASTKTSWQHFHSTVTQSYQNLAQLQRCNCVRVHLYAYVPHWNVLKHFIYDQCGCEKQSKVVISLNHDVMVSFPLDNHQELPKSDPASACYGVRVHSYACIPNWKVKEYFIYVQNGGGKQSKVLISRTMTSWHHFHSTVTQNCQNLAQLQRCYCVRVHSYACVPNLKVKKHFIYVQNEGGKQ